MKKTFFSLALAAVAAVSSISASAQTPNATVCDRQCDKKENCRTECRKPGKPECNPFDGLNLTAEQQQALNAIPAPCKVMREARKQCKADSTVCGNRARQREVAKDVRINYLKQVKAVLSPEQYVQFLENTFVNQQSKGMKGGKHKGHGDKGKKGGKDMKKRAPRR